ncbi:unnamed protein product [Urochloa humidicola]
MADLAIGVSKTALDLVVNRVKTAIKEEAQQWQIVQRDLVFITDEFEMMQSFLNLADQERVKNHVVRTWVQQVRDLSYDVEDCIEFVLHLDTDNHRSWWLRLLPSFSKTRAALPIDKAVADITQLKARVVDVSQRNMRYNLIGDSGSKPIAEVQMSASAPTTRAFNILIDARHAPKTKSGISDLATVFNWQDEDLRVTSVYGSVGDQGAISVIREFYDNKRTRKNFSHRAWVKLTHPFNPREFIRNLVAQFLTNSYQDEKTIIGVDVLTKLEEINLVEKFVLEVDTNRFLIMLEDVSSMEQWDAIKTYLPNRRNKSRIIVSTHHVWIARLCTGQPYGFCMLQQSSVDPPSHVFYYDDERGLRKQEQATDSSSADLFGRDGEVDELVQLITERRHISVWGPPGVGKTALMKAVYDRSVFRRKVWANVSDPFNAEGLSQYIISGLHEQEDRGRKRPGKKNMISLFRLLFDPRSLVVIDDLKSEQEWDFIKENVTCRMPPGYCVVIITADESIATYCAQGSYGAVYRVKGLEADTALRLFEEKASFTKDEGNLSSEVWRLLSMCSGLPQFIVTLAGHVAKKQSIEERKAVLGILNDSFIHELENNRNFACLNGIFAWLHSNFDASPQLLKKCIFYLSIFPQDSIVRRKRLVRRWTAEGFSGGTHRNSLEELEMLINKLVDLGIMQTIPAAGAMRKNSCQVNRCFLEYIISRQMEEKTFLPLEVSNLEGTSSLSTQRVGRHLAIGSSWERDEFDFNSLDFSRLRSLTVSGVWQTFFISEKMRVLRVLDLEGTSNINVLDNNFKQIGAMLPRLKFLSLRGCKEVSSLPESLGYMSQLQTLDIRGTSVLELPRSIVMLHKLQNICAGTLCLCYNHIPALDALSRRRRARELLSSLLSKLGGRPVALEHTDGGVVVPTGIEKLKALRTLSVVNANAAGGEFILRDVKKLTQLCKLGVYGLAKENSKEFWSLISDHKHLESLSVWGGVFPKDVKFPPNLRKLSLDMPTCVLKPRGLRALVALEKVRTLRLRIEGALPLFPGGAILGRVGSPLLDIFGQLKVLQVACKGRFSVKFPEGAMKELEQLTLQTEASLTILDSMEQLGKLKGLRTLRLRFHKYHDTSEEEETPSELQFGNKQEENVGASRSTPYPFGQLKFLEVVCMGDFRVKFAQGAMKELEQLTLQTDASLRLDGLNHLGKLKKLHTLCLRFANMDQDKDLQFGEEQETSVSSCTSSPPDHFGSLKVLEIACVSASHVKFAVVAMKKLRQLTLRTVTLLAAEDTKELGKLKKLRTLCLDFHKCQDEKGEIQFGEEQQTIGTSSSSSTAPPDLRFGKLKVLDIVCSSRLHVKFAGKAMRSLEQLNLHCLTGSDIYFSGLDHLPLLKQVWIKGSLLYHNTKLMEVLQKQLGGHKNKPVVRVEQELHSS